MQIWRQPPGNVLQESGTRTGSGRGSAKARRMLVISEIAVACMLLVGAGLLARSLINVLSIDLGFQPEQVFALRTSTEQSFSSSAERVQFYQGLRDRVSSVPGVASVGFSDTLPLGYGRVWNVIAQGRSVATEDEELAYVRVVDRHYLETMGLSLHSGRYFDDQDSESGQPAVIISETMARLFWPDQNPLGKIADITGTDYTVIGVVADVRHELESGLHPDFYLDFRQVDGGISPYLIVRGNREPEALLAGVRSVAKEHDSTMATNEFTTLNQVVDQAIAPRRLITGILSSFSSFALLLAGIGLYGTVAYSVGQRRREIGIRIAVGARRSSLLGMIVGEGLAMAAIGLVIGLLGAWFVSSILQNQLFGVTTGDFLSYAVAAMTLAVVVLAACAIPAGRAARIDPISALRGE